MNNQFDELTKSLAHSVTRRAALKKFGIGLAGMALACFGLANKAEADPKKGSPYGSPAQRSVRADAQKQIPVTKCVAHSDCPADNPHCCKGHHNHCSTYTCETDNYWGIDNSYCVFNCF